MVGEPGFHSVLAKKIRQGTALVAPGDDGRGLLFSAKPPQYHVRWLVSLRPGPVRRPRR